MRRAHRLLRVDLARLPIAAVVVTTMVATMMVSTASAENPLYCSGTYSLNGGCAGPHGLIRINEARNESGGCIAIQMWASGYGYSEPWEACGGKVIAEELTVHVESFPKCWNRTNASDVIHCRYSIWPT